MSPVLWAWISEYWIVREAGAMELIKNMLARGYLELKERERETVEVRRGWRDLDNHLLHNLCSSDIFTVIK
jgi:hypothetical protein